MAATVVVDRRSGKIRRHEFIGNDTALEIDKAAQMATPPSRAILRSRRRLYDRLQ
jgi:hypothetical protein